MILPSYIALICSYLLPLTNSDFLTINQLKYIINSLICPKKQVLPNYPEEHHSHSLISFSLPSFISHPSTDYHLERPISFLFSFTKHHASRVLVCPYFFVVVVFKLYPSQSQSPRQCQHI